MSETEYAEYRCSACKKEVKSVVIQCVSWVQLFFHLGCVFKHKTYKGNKLVKCEGPFNQIVITEMKKTNVTGDSRERLVSEGSAEAAGTAAGRQVNVDTKID